MEIHLRISGILLIILAFIHIGFPNYFKWKQELGSLSIMNRQMMYIHSFFIAFVVLLMGILCLTSSDLLAGTELGKRISLGFGIFWFVRLLIQFFGYSSKLWKGNLFATIIHILFTLFWIYLSWIFLSIYIN